MAVEITVESSLDARGKPVIAYHCPEKRMEPLKIVKSQDGFQFLEVVSEKGKVPAELSGLYTSENLLDKKIRHYLEYCKETPTARRENFAKEREARKAKKEAEKE